MSEERYYLNNSDPDDVHDVFIKVEQSFGIRFTTEDMNDVNTLGDFYNVVHKKIALEHQDSCTTQQAFYKLRNCIINSTDIKRQNITPQTNLKDVFPENERLWLVSIIEKELNLKLKILEPKQSVSLAVFIGVIASLITFFFSWQYALSGLVIFSAVGFFARKFGKELKVKTLGQLAEKISREHYLKCRRNISTLNHKEIDKKIQELFQHELDLDVAILTPQASFN
ncbi:MAG: hypothetical protein EOP47_14380 [Sphingobacteriaceae bacterium]|nr:MAG: hypothetical protein EOP47_14380 [Sphingobacteriaceae bacterium]